MLALAAGSVVAGAADHALALAIQAAPENIEVQHRSDNNAYLSGRAQMNATGANSFGSRTGYQSGFYAATGTFQPGGINPIYHFKLPVLAAGETVAAANFSFSVLKESSSGVLPTFNCDLYAIGFDTSDPPNMGNANTVGQGSLVSTVAQQYFFTGTNQTGAGVSGAPIQKLQDNIIQPADWIPNSATGSANNAPHSMSGQASSDLGSYIVTNLYGNGGFTPGHDSLILRSSPDSTTVASGTQRYYFSYMQMDNVTTFQGAVYPTLNVVAGAQWAKDDSVSNWSSPGSWSSGVVPNGVGATAIMGSLITANQTANVDAPQTLGTLAFKDNDSYNVAGSAITMSQTSGNAAISAYSGNHTVSAPVVLSSSTTISVLSGAGLTLSGGVSGPGAVVKTDAGTATLSGNNTSIGGITVQAGKLQVSRMQENNAVTLNAGTTLQVLDSSPTLPSVPSGNNAFVSRPSSLTIPNNGAALGTRTYGATVDLGNNDLIIDYDATNPAADIEDMVRSGFNAGGAAWTGTGITSSTAANVAASGNYALAVADNAHLMNKCGDGPGVKPQFDGQNVDDTTVIVKFTHRVDLDLDGFVTPNDAIVFATNYTQNGNGVWATGDVDYDGKHTQNDAIIFATFYNGTLPSLPEPSVALGAGALLLTAAGGRRRRKA